MQFSYYMCLLAAQLLFRIFVSLKLFEIRRGMRRQNNQLSSIRGSDARRRHLHKMKFSYTSGFETF